MKILGIAAILALVAAAHPAFALCAPQSDVLASLRCLPGVAAEEVESTVVGYRQFEIHFRQPTDHAVDGGETFDQRLVLLHAGFDQPLVLQTGGYSISKVALSGLARTFGANQIQVEHRFFSDSTPASRDWSKLDIGQSAADFHEITAAFKQLYQDRWVGTGASKGGMTSVFHRRFYPSDLDGTVADVAPLSFAPDDQRYVGFVDAVGGNTYAACRARLKNLQIALLQHRDEILPTITGAFDVLGGKSVAFEHAVIELPFAFWQYQDPSDPEVGCNAVPGADAPVSDQAAFLDKVNGAGGYGDESFATFAPYYYQSGTQLGAPAAELAHLTEWRRHDYSISQYMPPGVPYTYSDAAMRDIEAWVRDTASGIMFVYGELDPWTAGAFPDASGNDMHKYIVPGGNHGSKFFRLPDAARAAALKTLAGWFDKEPVEDSTRRRGEPSLEDFELSWRRQHRLP